MDESLSCDCSVDCNVDEENFKHQSITVKFQISDTQIVAQVYTNCTSIGDIKKDIGQKFEIDPKYLLINQWGEDLADDCLLHEACKNEFGIVEFYLDVDESIPVAANGKKPFLNIQIYYNKFRLADFITVHIAGDKCQGIESRDIVVEIHNKTIIKPFLGGYKDPKTDIEYLDAFSQTGPPLESFKTDGIISRESQTISTRKKIIDTMHDAGNQSFGDSTNLIHISDSSDIIIIPKKYKDYIETRREIRKLGKIILIQRNFRRFLILRFMKNAAAEYRRLTEEQRNREMKRMDIMVDSFQLEAVTKTFPRTKEDFDVIIAQVQKWKSDEIIRITNMYTGGPKISEFKLLLEKEIQLINGIETQRSVVLKTISDYNEQKLLHKLGEPLKWIGYKDLIVEMDLIRTQRVRYLNALYLKMKKNLKKSDRLMLLDQIKEALLQEEFIPQIGELIELIDREKNLLILSKYCQPEILRKRQSVLLVDIIKYSKDKPETKPLTRLCDTCKVIKPLSNFALLTRQTSVETCQKCFDLKEVISDHTVYRSILRAVQREERKFGTLTSYAFILQEEDIRFIVVKIWHSHSILGKDFNQSDLRLPRWIKSEDWSPWNCVCLNSIESRNHNKVIDLKDIYDDHIIQDIKSKHLLAKTTFKRLQTVETDLVESGNWWKVGVADKVL